MRIVFIRHGHPDYKKDCLTEFGKLHAKAVTERLIEENIQTVYSSTRGRAVETAQYIAGDRGMEFIPCDFMCEIGWGTLDGEPLFQNGHPWYTAWDMVTKGEPVVNADWALQEPFCRNKVIHRVQAVVNGLDLWLAELGYERDGGYYRVRRNNPDTVVMVSHAGSSSAAIGHMLNIPFPLLCASFGPDFTAVTILQLDGEDGSLITPKVEIMNDARHISDIKTERIIDD